MLRDGRPAHLEMFRKRVDEASGLDEEAEHPALFEERLHAMRHA